MSSLFRERFLDWYARSARPLPWREPSCTPGGVLVSEVMSHQTPVARVEPVWHEWVQRWPTPADLAEESPGEVVRAWGRLGYPRRALRLREAAVAIVERHGGEVPGDEEALRALPGVGAYTAAAVAAFAFGRRTTVVDTNDEVNQKQLGQALDVSAPNLAVTLDRMVEQGWVRRERSERDRRAQLIRLTPAGQTLVTRARRIGQTMEQDALKVLSPAEQALLIELLQRVAQRRPRHR